jgi:hypothetical protein
MQLERNSENEQKFQRFGKSKEMQPDTQADKVAAHCFCPNTHRMNDE